MATDQHLQWVGRGVDGGRKDDWEFVEWLVLDGGMNVVVVVSGEETSRCIRDVRVNLGRWWSFEKRSRNLIRVTKLWEAAAKDCGQERSVQ